MNENLEYLRTFARFPFSLRRFTRHTLTLQEAQERVRQRLEHRDENFLRIAERSIFGNPRSPYLPMLRIAACQLGDLRDGVRRSGLEHTLSALRRAGVYVTFEEFKGRRPIVRSGKTIPTTLHDFDNPFSRRDMTAETGGSTGLAMAVNQNLDHIAEQAELRMITYAANGVLGVPTALWSPPLPGSALESILTRYLFGQTPEPWFTPSGWRDSKDWLKYDAAAGYMLFWMRALGMRVSLPQLVRPDDARVVASWVHSTLEKHPRCMLNSSVSRAVRACLAAGEQGWDLTGAMMGIGGEPMTPAKAAAIERVGARWISGYSTTETGRIGTSCIHPVGVSDVHLYRDAVALITHPHPVERLGIEVPAFNVTTLLATSPLVLLNAELDDYGIVEERACGCALEPYGYTTHLREIRSYSKLVGEGVTLIGNEMVRVIEQVLPQRFGGGPLDYQLLEEEDGRGLTRLYLIVSPRVALADEADAIAVVLAALRQSSPMADAARAIWEQSRTLQVKRMQPLLTSRGKQLPLHIQRYQRDA